MLNYQQTLDRKKLFKKSFTSLFICSSMLLSSCFGGVWTGANLFYDRHTVIHSLNDYELNIHANRALFYDDYFVCAECHLDIAVFNGDILLAGHLETEEMRHEAYKRIEAESGYRRLFKEISIKAIRTNVAKDSWITAKIRSKIIADSEINPRMVKVVTSDQVVYLMGDVIASQADWIIDIAKTTTGVERVVKLFMYYHLSNTQKVD